MSRVMSGHENNSLLDYDMNPVTAQYILFTSLQKLDQAKRSRGGLRLRHSLMITVTALKAKQLLWSQNQSLHENEYISKSHLHEDEYETVHLACHVYDQPVSNQEISDFTYLHDPNEPFFPPPIDEMMEVENTNIISTPSKRLRLDYTFPSLPSPAPSYNEPYLVRIK
ncbi:zinc finger-containing-like protein [Schistosoma japonicum]|uniref:Zinc finger-containing-like protein n=1 Tax=Schistosoma japonicum TaxID=6182 RepID=A0A4Z2DIB7_SCHJA|nr:zinc finger-containing-like protein [Schistosoma japonicum]TNN16188.1 zinc finger-containing-like protein [Schistosoma japonicum]